MSLFCSTFEKYRHRQLACVGAGLRKRETHNGFLGLDVQAGVLAAVQVHPVLNDRTRPVLKGLNEDCAAYTALPAAGANIGIEGLGVRETSVLKRLGESHGVEFNARQRKAEHASEVEELHVVGCFDRNDVFVDVVGIGAMSNIVVAMDTPGFGRVVRVIAGVALLQIKARIRPVKRVLVDLDATFDNRLGDVVEDQYVDRAGDADIVGRGRAARPGIEQAGLQTAACRRGNR